MSLLSCYESLGTTPAALLTREATAVCCPASARWHRGQGAAAGSPQSAGAGLEQTPGGCARQCGWARGSQGPPHRCPPSPGPRASVWRKSWQVFTDFTGAGDWQRPLVTGQHLWPSRGARGVGSGRPPLQSPWPPPHPPPTDSGCGPSRACIAPLSTLSFQPMTPWWPRRGSSHGLFPSRALR